MDDPGYSDFQNNGDGSYPEPNYTAETGNPLSDADERKYWQVLDTIIRKAAQDKTFERRFLTDPGAVFVLEGITLPPSIDVEVVKYSRQTRYIFLPPDDLSSYEGVANTAVVDAAREDTGKKLHWSGIVVTLEKAAAHTVIGIVQATGNGQWWMIIPNPET